MQYTPDEAAMTSNPSSGPELNMVIDRTPAEIVVHCTGKIRSDTTQQLKATVKPLLSESKSVVLDLTDVAYMDSSGLGTVVGLYISAKAARSQLTLINLNEHLKEIFSITRIGQAMAEGRHPRDPMMP
jgi:anti-anti-sigma factor